MGGKRKKKSLNPNDTKESPAEKKGKRNSNMSKRNSNMSNRSSVAHTGNGDERAANSNRYAILTDVEDDEASIQTAATPAGHNVNIEPSNPHGEGPSGLDRTKQKLPPLVVKSVPLDKLMRTMKAIGVTAVYQLTRMGIKIVTSSRDEFNKSRTYLNKAGVEFYTHDVATEKPFKAVVRGLPTMEPEDIVAELRENYKLHPLAVFPMNRRNQAEPFSDCLYLIHFTKGSTTLRALQAIRSINNVIVKWEAYKGPNQSITQCMRCLNFGHGTRNCNLKPRCNFCCQQHLTEHCILEGACAFKCANCNGEHLSTDKACIKREEYQRIRMQATARNQQGNRNKKREAIDLDLFPELPRRPRPIPILPPLPLPNQQRQRNASPNGAPPGFRPYHSTTNPNQWSSEANQPDFRPDVNLQTDPLSQAISQLATLVAELQKMMMQMMHLFMNINIHHPNP